MLCNFQRVDFSGGGFKLIKAPSLSAYPQIRAYHLELLNLVRQFQHYELIEADTVLFEEYGTYYQAVADLLTPRFQAADLTPCSRHSFFIATAPVCPQEGSDTWFAGLSQLEELMGIKMVFDAPTGDSEEQESVDPNLEIAAALLLFSPQQAQWLARTYSPRQLGEILNIASKAQNTDNSGVSEAQHNKDIELFERNEEAIAAHFAQQGGLI